MDHRVSESLSDIYLWNKSAVCDTEQKEQKYIFMASGNCGDRRISVPYDLGGEEPVYIFLFCPFDTVFCNSGSAGDEMGG